MHAHVHYVETTAVFFFWVPQMAQVTLDANLLHHILDLSHDGFIQKREFLWLKWFEVEAVQKKVAGSRKMVMDMFHGM